MNIRFEELAMGLNVIRKEEPIVVYCDGVVFIEEDVKTISLLSALYDGSISVGEIVTHIENEFDMGNCTCENSYYGQSKHYRFDDYSIFVYTPFDKVVGIVIGPYDMAIDIWILKALNTE